MWPQAQVNTWPYQITPATQLIVSPTAPYQQLSSSKSDNKSVGSSFLKSHMKLLSPKTDSEGISYRPVVDPEQGILYCCNNCTSERLFKRLMDLKTHQRRSCNKKASLSLLKIIYDKDIDTFNKLVELYCPELINFDEQLAKIAQYVGRSTLELLHKQLNDKKLSMNECGSYMLDQYVMNTNYKDNQTEKNQQTNTNYVPNQNSHTDSITSTVTDNNNINSKQFHHKLNKYNELNQIQDLNNNKQSIDSNNENFDIAHMRNNQIDRNNIQNNDKLEYNEMKSANIDRNNSAISGQCPLQSLYNNVRTQNYSLTKHPDKFTPNCSTNANANIRQRNCNYDIIQDTKQNCNLLTNNEADKNLNKNKSNQVNDYTTECQCINCKCSGKNEIKLSDGCSYDISNCINNRDETQYVNNNEQNYNSNQYNRLTRSNNNYFQKTLSSYSNDPNIDYNNNFMYAIEDNKTRIQSNIVANNTYQFEPIHVDESKNCLIEYKHKLKEPENSYLPKQYLQSTLPICTNELANIVATTVNAVMTNISKQNNGNIQAQHINNLLAKKPIEQQLKHTADSSQSTYSADYNIDQSFENYSKVNYHKNIKAGIKESDIIAYMNLNTKRLNLSKPTIDTICNSIVTELSEKIYHTIKIQYTKLKNIIDGVKNDFDSLQDAVNNHFQTITNNILKQNSVSADSLKKSAYSMNQVCKAMTNKFQKHLLIGNIDNYRRTYNKNKLSSIKIISPFKNSKIFDKNYGIINKNNRKIARTVGPHANTNSMYKHRKRLLLNLILGDIKIAKLQKKN